MGADSAGWATIGTSNICRTQMPAKIVAESGASQIGGISDATSLLSDQPATTPMARRT